MKIGRVAGTVVATICSPALEGRKLLFVDLLDLEGNETGRDLIRSTPSARGRGRLFSSSTRATVRDRYSKHRTLPSGPSSWVSSIRSS